MRSNITDTYYVYVQLSKINSDVFTCIYAYASRKAKTIYQNNLKSSQTVLFNVNLILFTNKK